jgi:hypothetical protein
MLSQNSLVLPTVMRLALELGLGPPTPRTPEELAGAMLERERAGAR